MYRKYSLSRKDPGKVQSEGTFVAVDEDRLILFLPDKRETELDLQAELLWVHSNDHPRMDWVDGSKVSLS